MAVLINALFFARESSPRVVDKHRWRMMLTVIGTHRDGFNRTPSARL
jgi:hypothetical protein